MKVKVVEDSSLESNEIIITCRELTPEVEKLVKELSDSTIIASHRGREFPLELNDVIFFETEGDDVYVHLKHAAYTTKFRLYELEGILPQNFIRIAKSTIVNCRYIESIERSLSSSRLVSFFDSHKVVYVSRMYYPHLREKLKERSLI